MLKKRKDDSKNVNKMISLEDAEKMFEGNFHDENENDEEINNTNDNHKNNKNLFLNRANNNLKEDLDLVGFEKAI